MQLVAYGPDVPDSLLRAHEEGRVVFFCGAGISYPAGLPGFQGLVDAIYGLVGTERQRIEQRAYEQNQFDTTLELLERRVAGGRREVRTQLAKALEPKLEAEGARDTHTALLELGRNPDGALRLVTTNFDRIFVRLTAGANPPARHCQAPFLPVPKSSGWNGLVYLHGLLPEDPTDETALNQLVLTSGDFGHAYLTERWAARFVSELFRNHVVCFVGYSISDPVLRYTMDALAADRMLGETTPQAYAFGECRPGDGEKQAIEWEAKGVIPVLYQVPDSKDHSALHRTLKAWAGLYRDGSLGKERIVVEHAMAAPSTSSDRDDFAGRMLWALSDPSGLPAKRFADLDPVPSLDWLEALSDKRYGQGDLCRFGVSPPSRKDDKLRFSLLCRPSPSALAPWMAIASHPAEDSRWDEVMFRLGQWLVRHLDDPKLILWIAENGGHLDDRFAQLIEERLTDIVRLEREGKTNELARIRAQAPNAVPGEPMRRVWRLLLTGKARTHGRGSPLHQWKYRLDREGLTTTARFALRELLAARVALRKPLRWPEELVGPADAKSLRRLFNWELVLAAADVSFVHRRLQDSESWRLALPSLLDELQRLLLDALDLLNELGEVADNGYDHSEWHLPSISPHPQNRRFCEWVVLIELLRDAWLAVRDRDQSRATRVATAWFDIGYSTFKRLALFAASQDGSIEPDEWVRWLGVDDGRWLWSPETHRETLRLLVRRGQHLPPEQRSRLEAAILAGPPRAMYRDDLDPESWQLRVDRSVWLRLAKLRSSGGPLGESASQRLAALSERYDTWRLADDERDEFLVYWPDRVGALDFKDRPHGNLVPRKRSELTSWLKRSAPARDTSEDDWQETCRTRFFHCALALCDLAGENEWPARWSDALLAWSEPGLAARSWRFIAPLVVTMPDDVLLKVMDSLSWWLESASKSLDCHEEIFLRLCQRLLASAQPGTTDGDDPVGRALNHPVGHVAQALLNLWFKGAPKDGDRLPDKLEPFFTRLCNARVGQFRHGRVPMYANLVAFFRVDPKWTQTHLLPLLNWTTDLQEARAVWQGVLCSPRLYQPLFCAEAFKTPFLETAKHYDHLGGLGRQFAALLTFVALEPPDTYGVQDLRTAFGSLPQRGLREAASTLVDALEGAGDRRETYWRNRLQPFWREIWPKNRAMCSEEMAASLAALCLAAGEEFPQALGEVRDWLQPLEAPDFVVSQLRESRLDERFPRDALSLLGSVIDDQPWAPSDLEQCLEAVARVEPTLAQDSVYQRLRDYVRRRRR